jgi:hypothetical protein
MLARCPIRVLLALIIALAPVALAGCESKPVGPAPTDASGTNPDLLKNYPAKTTKPAR